MFVDKVLNEAIKLETSDIHIEPFKETAHVRFRVDGVLRIMDQFTDFLNKDLKQKLAIYSEYLFHPLFLLHYFLLSH